MTSITDTNWANITNLRFLNQRVWHTACGQQKKNGFWHVFWAQSAQFLNYKKITLQGINPHRNVFYMQNLRFLHWTVWRTACGQTWKNWFWHVFWAQSAQFWYYKKITLDGINPHTNVTNMQNLRFLHWTIWYTAYGRTDRKVKTEDLSSWLEKWNTFSLWLAVQYFNIFIFFM